jgi:hypothetical protein
MLRMHTRKIFESTKKSIFSSFYNRNIDERACNGQLMMPNPILTPKEVFIKWNSVYRLLFMYMRPPPPFSKN